MKHEYLAGLMLVALVAAGCVDDPAAPEPEPEGGPITLAAAIPQSGRHGELGNEVARGYRLAVEILNEKGGVHGRPLQLVLRDDRSDAETSARLYAEFIDSDAIDALLGPYSSPITNAVLAVTEAAGIPLVAPAAAAPEIWAGRQRQWSAQLLNPAPSYLKGSVEVAALVGARDVALVWEDTAFPASVAGGVRVGAAVHGLDIVFAEAYAVGAADHEALLAAARDAGATLFIGGGYATDAIEFTRAATAAGYRPLLMSLLLGPAEPNFIDEVGEAGRCVMGNAPWDPTIRTSGFISDSETMVQRHEAAHGTTPGYHAAAGFAAVELLAEGIDQAISATGDTDRTAIRDFLFTTMTETVLGPYSVYPLEDVQAGGQRALTGLQVQWQDDGADGLTRRIIHPWAIADAAPCLMR
ncbi:amino acid ABC transporter substrate-binding protein [Candidatus Palauibacter sp.]|uniref:amino acid ABC transporter substrate-binding protein n=1 Tax=Candidatus Palauibacter sp. TaxID=3101350 RepID=UPI003B0277D5